MRGGTFLFITEKNGSKILALEKKYYFCLSFVPDAPFAGYG